MYKHWYERIFSVINNKKSGHKVLTILGVKLKFKNDKKNNSINNNKNDVLYNISYSQCGEDIIVENLMRSYFKKDIFNYLDIGANHYARLSNTKKFYDKGCKGVLIEPDPILYKDLCKYRSKDICLNCGISDNNESNSNFYIMNPSVLSTFDKDEAEKCVREGYKIKEIIQIPLVNINDILKKYFNYDVDFISIDTEGFDLKILKSMDFNTCRPKVICVETLEFYTNQHEQKKLTDISDFLMSNNYSIYADTYINTIYADNRGFKQGNV